MNEDNKPSKSVEREVGHPYGPRCCAVPRLREQIYRLADFIIAEVPGEPAQSQGAVDTAIRVIADLKSRLTASESALAALREENERLKRWTNCEEHSSGGSEWPTPECLFCSLATLRAGVEKLLASPSAEESAYWQDALRALLGGGKKE